MSIQQETLSHHLIQPEKLLFCGFELWAYDEEAVDAFLEMLDAQCVSHEGDYYVTYHFKGFDVQIGYASFDI